MQAQAAELQSVQISAVGETIRRVYADTLGGSADALGVADRWLLRTDQLVEQYLKTPWSGELYSKRIWRNTNKLAGDLQKHIGDMVMLGKSPRELKAALQRDYSVSYEMADRLIRTEASNAYNTASLALYRSEGVERVRFRAERDGLLCDRCRTYSQAHGGIYGIDDVPHIPVHPRCRCRYVPAIDPPEDAIKRIKAWIAQMEKNSRATPLAFAAKSGTMGMQMDLQLFATPRDLTKQSIKSIQKGIKSQEAHIARHRDKIANPMQYDPEWVNLSDVAKKGHIRHWEKEIRTAEKNIRDAYEELERRRSQ